MCSCFYSYNTGTPLRIQGEIVYNNSESLKGDQVIFQFIFVGDNHSNMKPDILCKIRYT